MKFSCCALVSLVCAASVFGADNWIKLKTEQFELFTNASERRGRELLGQFERIHGFFAKDTRSSAKPMLPARVVVFKGAKEFEQYRPNEVAAAFYSQGVDAHYVAMQASGDERVAYHEFVHLLTAHRELNLPVWFGEGFAELYSTLKPVGKKVQVGHLIEGHFYVKRQEKWIPVGDLIQATHDSPLYNRRNHAGAFYAESWALMHMLNLSAEYRPQFGKFFLAILNGTSSVNAFQTVYGKTPAQVDKDLQAYFQSDRFFAGLFDEPLAGKVEIAPAEAASELEVEMLLANLIARPATQAKAKARYEALISRFPESPEPHAGLGYLEWRAGRRDAARAQFAEAMKLGSENRRLLWDLAKLAQDDAAVSSAAAERLLTLDPGHIDAKIMLAFHWLKSGKNKEAYTILDGVKQVSEKQAKNYLTALGHAADRIGNHERALAAAQHLLRLAADTNSRIEASQFVDYLTKKKELEKLLAAPAPDRSSRVPFSGNPAAESESRRYVQPTGEIVEEKLDVERSPKGDPLQMIEGTFVQLNCAGNKATLFLNYAGKRFPLLIEQPGNIIVRNRGSSERMELECGPQRPARKATVHFVPKADAATGIQGVLWRLELH